jgi:hypothetical protein
VWFELLKLIRKRHASRDAAQASHTPPRGMKQEVL